MHALTVVTIMQAVISASFSVAKLRSGAQSDVDGTKRRDQRRELKQPPPPQSLAPWHTLPYMGREVRGCNNPSQGAKLSRFRDLFTARISIYAGTLPGWRVEAQGRQQTCACTAKVCLICIALAICFQMYDLPNCFDVTQFEGMVLITAGACACSWQEHRRAVKARRTQPKQGGHLHLRLPWHRRQRDRRDGQQR